MSDPWWTKWDPNTVTVNNTDPDTAPPDSWKICVINKVFFGDNEYDGMLGARISSVIVILITSTFFTMFPVIARRAKFMRIPKYVYLFARYFGTGVIIATAFVHLLDPAYKEIGPQSCVGMSGNWAEYSFVPAIVLLSIFVTFTLDLASGIYVERKYGPQAGGGHTASDPIEDAVVDKADGTMDPNLADPEGHHTHQGHDHQGHNHAVESDQKSEGSKKEIVFTTESMLGYEGQIAAFYILEFAVVFHSIMIGLNLGACSTDKFKTLYPVLVFHQSFEGLGIGARLSTIPFPKKKQWQQWALCIAYGLTTPIAVAIGLGVRTQYNSNSFSANIVSGVLDSISAGILIYTGLVELLAADFIFSNGRYKNLRDTLFNYACLVFGTGIMALIGKWA